MKKTRLVILVLFSIIFLIRTQIIYAGCTGSLQCYSKDPVTKVCQDVYHYAVCPGNTNQSDCEGNQNCECGVMSGGNCTWSAPCDCSWGSWSSCYSGGGGTICLKDRACNCTPSGCGSCTGSNWVGCTSTEMGCSEQSCPTYEGYGGGSVRDGTLNGDCSCGTKTCPPICTSSNPDAPVLSNPASGTIVNVNTSVNLDWNAISSWGEGCPNSNKYQVCVMSDSTCDLLDWVDVASDTTIKAWTPTSADSLVTWKVRSNNGSNTAESLTRTLRVNAPPTFSSLIIKNVDGGVVAGESGGTTLRNHICQTTFQNSSSSKKVIFEASVNDLDGATDIDTATLTWNGRNYSMTKGYSSGTGATMVVTVDYSIFSATVTDVYDLFVTVTDIYDASSGSVDTDRDWKVWDCYIPTSGTLYNGSAGQACFTGLGFSVPIDVGVSFDSLIFNNNNVSVRVFTVSKPSNYGGNYIVWGEIYHPRINKGTLYNENGDLLATGRVTRITDLGAGTAAQCPSNEFVIGNGIQALISAYSVNPEAQIDFSFIRDQEAWYQVVGAGVKSRNRLEYGVPVTAPLESKFLTLSSATNGNGLVSATDFNNINGNNNNEFGSPNNWYVLRNTNDLDIYNYNYFYNNFFVKAGVGVTGTDWAGKPENGIYLVKNSLNITSDFVLVDTTKTMMVIVNGDITIQPNVTRLDGIYIADGSINVGGISDNQLNINGMLYAGSDVKLYRSFTDKTDNNTTPAVKVNYSPGLIFNLPPEILRGLSGWREE